MRLAELDKGRKSKGNNDDWQHRHDPDARITKMKDGRTRLAHKAAPAVDLGGAGAVLHVEVRGADEGDTQSLGETIVGAAEQLRELTDDAHTSDQLHKRWMTKMAAGEGYHSNETMVMLEEMVIRGYVSEPNRGRRNWRSKAVDIPFDLTPISELCVAAGLTLGLGRHPTRLNSPQFDRISVSEKNSLGTHLGDMSMPKFRCSNCDQKLSGPEESVGKRAKCPKCGKVITIPMGAPNDPDRRSRSRSRRDRFIKAIRQRNRIRT